MVQSCRSAVALANGVVSHYKQTVRCFLPFTTNSRADPEPKPRLPGAPFLTRPQFIMLVCSQRIANPVSCLCSFGRGSQELIVGTIYQIQKPAWWIVEFSAKIIGKLFKLYRETSLRTPTSENYPADRNAVPSALNHGWPPSDAIPARPECDCTWSNRTLNCNGRQAASDTATQQKSLQLSSPCGANQTDTKRM